MALLAYLAGAIGFPLLVSERSSEGSASVRACGCPAPERVTQKCCCCSHPTDNPAKASCCSSPTDKTEAEGETEWRWVAGLSAWRCQGVQPLLGGVGAALTPESPLAWSPGTLPSPWLRQESVLPARLVLPLLEPPPRSFTGVA